VRSPALDNLRYQQSEIFYINSSTQSPHFVQTTMKASILVCLCALLSGTFASPTDDAELVKRQPDIRAQCLLSCEKLHAACLLKCIRCQVRCPDLDPRITPCIKPFKDCNTCCLKPGGKASKCATGFPPGV
jgi:hypothetical protein